MSPSLVLFRLVCRYGLIEIAYSYRSGGDRPAAVTTTTSVTTIGFTSTDPTIVCISGSIVGPAHRLYLPHSLALSSSLPMALFRPLTEYIQRKAAPELRHGKMEGRILGLAGWLPTPDWGIMGDTSRFGGPLLLLCRLSTVYSFAGAFAARSFYKKKRASFCRQVSCDRCWTATNEGKQPAKQKYGVRVRHVPRLNEIPICCPKPSCQLPLLP